MSYRRPAWVEVDLNSIKQNIHSFQAVLSKNTAIMAVVKANGYGHGAVEVAKTAVANGVQRLGVALPEELVELRQAGITAPIHLLGDITSDGADVVVEYDGIASVSRLSQAQRINEAAGKFSKKAKVHVKINTGMNRLGIRPSEAADFLKELKSFKNIEVEGIFTHFATADHPGSDYARDQLTKFKDMVGELEELGICPPIKHCANSAAVLLMPDSHLDMVRIGITIYGLYPSNPPNFNINLVPALSLKAKISQIAEVGPGEGISYGATFIPEKKCRIATLPLGYADGYTRLLSNKSEVLIGGKRCRVVGVVTMDQFMVLLPDDLKAAIGDDVVLIGKQRNDEITADELANLIGTINYEIVCMLSKRLPRIYAHR